MMTYDLNAHLFRQRAFSRATFGPGPRTKMVLDHIRKEAIEIESAPYDLEEWIDVILLALDGAWRCAEAMGVPHDFVPARVVETLALKQLNNEMRDWPNWRTADPDQAIEHIDCTKRETFTVPAGHEAVRDADGRATGETRPARDGCPLVSCGSPYLCRAGCREAASENRALYLPGDSGV
jgi:hypothetical protein